MLSKVLIATFALGLGLSGCANGRGSGSVSNPVASEVKNVSEPSAANLPWPILGSRNWQAVITPATDGSGSNKLVISGELDLPTPGYRVSWIPGPLDRRNPPRQSINLELLRPEGMVMQVVTPTPVVIEISPASPRYREIVIIHQGEPVVSLSDVNSN